MNDPGDRRRPVPRAVLAARARGFGSSRQPRASRPFGRRDDPRQHRAHGLAHIAFVDDIARDEHFVDRGIIVDVEDKQFGTLPVHNILPRLSETPGTFRRPAPELGEHTAEVMLEAGIDPATVAG